MSMFNEGSVSSFNLKETESKETFCFRDYEISFLSRCFAFFGKKGDFEVRFDSDLFGLWISFYSEVMYADVVLAPSYCKVLQSKDGRMIFNSDKLISKVADMDGTPFVEELRGHTWTI